MTPISVHTGSPTGSNKMITSRPLGNMLGPHLPLRLIDVLCSWAELGVCPCIPRNNYVFTAKQIYVYKYICLIVQYVVNWHISPNDLLPHVVTRNCIPSPVSALPLWQIGILHSWHNASMGELWHIDSEVGSSAQWSWCMQHPSLAPLDSHAPSS